MEKIDLELQAGTKVRVKQNVFTFWFKADDVVEIVGRGTGKLWLCINDQLQDELLHENDFTVIDTIKSLIK